MSNLTRHERSLLEKVFDMKDGYILDFSNRTFANFFDEYRIDIDAQCYHANGSSKANRMRMHWVRDEDSVVGRVINGLIDYATENACFHDSITTVMIENCRKIAQRLLINQPVAELDALAATADEHDFDVVAEHIREAIEKNQPEGALDRLHTFVIKFVRAACRFHGIEVPLDKPLHSLFGEYVRKLKDDGHLESAMTERILKSSISALDAFSNVRNTQSLAHDNPILNYEESLLIFNDIAALIRFIKSLQDKIKNKVSTKSAEQ